MGPSKMGEAWKGFGRSFRRSFRRLDVYLDLKCSTEQLLKQET